MTTLRKTWTLYFSKFIAELCTSCFQRTILDLICEIIGLKFPTWTDEVKVALSAVDPSYPKDSWKLQEGFVVQEALVVLPHLALNT